MEHLSGGNLLDRIQNTMFTEQNVAKIVNQLLLSINYLHEQNPPIAHRNIKLENILVTNVKANGDISIKLTDFGLGQYYSGPMKHRAGSLHFMAPEVLLDSKYTEIIDIWSATIVIYILLSGDLLYNGNTCMKVYNDMQNKDIGTQFQLSKWFVNYGED